MKTKFSLVSVGMVNHSFLIFFTQFKMIIVILDRQLIRKINRLDFSFRKHNTVESQRHKYACANRCRIPNGHDKQMTFSLYINFHVLHFFCKSWIIRGSYNTQSKSNTGKSIFWFQISVTTIWVVIKELCNATSKLPLHLKTPAHIKMGTMRHCFEKSLFTCKRYHISRYFSWTFGKRAKIQKLASQTCRMFLENFQKPSQKINSERQFKKYVSEGERVQNIKHPEMFWHFMDLALWHVTSERLFLLIW